METNEEEDPFPKVEFDWEMLLGKPDHRCFGMTGSSIIGFDMRK